MKKIIGILEGFLWYDEKYYTKEIKEIPEIMEKTMVNYLSKEGEKVP
jgi:uncharacterized protein YneF (UPF0154 family)